MAAARAAAAQRLSLLLLGGALLAHLGINYHSGGGASITARQYNDQNADTIGCCRTGCTEHSSRYRFGMTA